MKKAIFAGKSYFIYWGADKSIEAGLSAMGERVGFRLLTVEGPEELLETVGQVKKLIGILCSTGQKVMPMLSAAAESKVIRVDDRDLVGKVIAEVDRQIIKGVPPSLVELVCNSIADVTEKVLGAPLMNLQASSDFSQKFSHLITCDASAEGFSSKASCEADFAKLKQHYEFFRNKSDHQLLDAGGELCNQLLGLINSNLREINLLPRISLPLGAELGGGNKISQVDFMPMVRFMDAYGAMSIAMSFHIESNCPANWPALSTHAVQVEMEFF